LALSNIQIRALARDHAYRIVDNMDSGDLFDYAVDQIANSFDLDIDMLVSDIIMYEGDDCDGAGEFMIGAGIAPEEVDELIMGYT
jgi:hypothetical protein